MNSISTKKNKSIYKIYDKPFNDVFIDGVCLDQFLDNAAPNHSIRGLVHTFAGFLWNKKDEIFAWERIIPKEKTIEICPIVICPDDGDFYCGTIVAEIENTGKTIIWKRIGYNMEMGNSEYELFGTKIDWLNNIGPYEFDLKEYTNVFNKIREENK